MKSHYNYKKGNVKKFNLYEYKLNFLIKKHNTAYKTINLPTNNSKNLP